MEGKKGKATIKTGGAGKFLYVTILRLGTLLINVNSITSQSKLNLPLDKYFFFILG